MAAPDGPRRYEDRCAGPRHDRDPLDYRRALGEPVGALRATFAAFPARNNPARAIGLVAEPLVPLALELSS